MRNGYRHRLKTNLFAAINQDLVVPHQVASNKKIQVIKPHFCKLLVDFTKYHQSRAKKIFTQVLHDIFRWQKYGKFLTSRKNELY
uniref:Uncharacterized protein n=1 Tax=Romanomermis culicivorax TaxID=13658 RepID=A0A915J718_ROMCU